MTRFKLSQQHLNILSMCPRKFQYIYLDQLMSPPTPEEEERLTWGNRFHLVMQQRELGLPIDTIVAEYPELKQCLTQFIQAAPESLISSCSENLQGFREPEYQLTLNFNNYLLVVIYDLIIADEKTAQIIDWKTYPRPQNREKLAQNWQTRLYRYLLVETHDYSPEQVSMTYWFVQSQTDTSPQSFTFPYDSNQHQKTQQDLTQLIQQLDDNLKEYEQSQDFPQVDLAKGYCSSCQFAIRCQRTSEPQENRLVGHILAENLPDVAKIEEVPI